MIFRVLLLLFATGGAFLIASGASATPLSSLNCDAVKPFFLDRGFENSEIPKDPISSRDLKTCGGLKNGGEVCCTPDMEARLQTWATNNFNEATKDALQKLQNMFHTRATKVHEFFNNLLKTSKKNFHEMFKKTYGILYEQNSYVFTDLFRELEKYYVKGSVDLDDVMETFFNTLYQKMFTVLNSQYKFDSKYLECVGNLMKDMRPFGDVPQKLGIQIKRSFIATRAFSQALQVAADVTKNMQELKISNECAAALTRMTACPSCSGVSNEVLACNDMCENVMKGCLSQHMALDTEWNQFVEAVNKIADRLLGPFNIEMLVTPINLKISEAIMNFQESSNDVSQRVFKGCGRPQLGRRRRRSRSRDEHEIDEQRSLSFEDEDEELPIARAQKSGRGRGEERSNSAIILDKLVKEIKLRIRDSRQIWLYLPYKMCTNNFAEPTSNTNNCWNGTHIDKYIYPVSQNGEAQSMNPEVRVTGSRSVIVKDQIFALGSISNRLHSAFNGHDVDWIDTEESWRDTSGSGSGSGGIETITEEDEDEDEDLTVVSHEGSGVIVTSDKPEEREESPQPRLTPAPTTSTTSTTTTTTTTTTPEPIVTRPDIVDAPPIDHVNNSIPHVIMVGASTKHRISLTLVALWPLSIVCMANRLL